jgi:hypothetical protein
VILLQVFSLCSQRSPLLGKLSECSTWFVFERAKRLFSTYGSAPPAFLGPQSHPHVQAVPKLKPRGLIHCNGARPINTRRDIAPLLELGPD